MEKKSFDFTLPKFMAKRKTPVNQNAENDPLPLFSSATNGEMEDNVTYGAKCSASLPNFLQHSFSPARFPGTSRTIRSRTSSPTLAAPQSPFTPRKKIDTTIDSSDEQSPCHSLTTHEDGVRKRCVTPFPFPQSRFSQTVDKQAQLYNQAQEQHSNSLSEEAFVVSESSVHHFDHVKASVARQKLDMDGIVALTRKQELTGLQFNEDNAITFENQVYSLTDQLLAVTRQHLAAAKKVQSDFFVESNSLKKELSIAEQQIINLKIQIEKLETSQAMVIERANNLSAEKETLREDLQVLREKVSISENQLEDMKFKLEETNSQLENREEILKKTLENVVFLENLAQSSEDQLSNLQTQFQTVSTERAITDEKCAQLSEQVKSLQDDIFSLQLNMNKAENDFRSTLCDSKSELEKERASHQSTQIILNDTCKNLDQIKEDFEKCVQNCLKMEESVKTSADEKYQLEVQFNDLNNKYKICEQSLNTSLENASSLESSLSSVQTQLDQLKQQMETTSADLIEARNKAMDLEETYESLQSKLQTLRNHSNDSEEKFRLDLNDARQLLENEIVSHGETKLRWDVCRNQLEENQSQHSLELSKFQSAKETWNDKKKILEAQVNELQVKLAAAEQNLGLTREESLALERRLELSDIEISTLRSQTQENSQRNSKLQDLLDDTRMKFALSEDELEAELVKCRKELDSLRETHLETQRHLSDTRDQLSSSESARNEAFLNQSKLQIKLMDLMKVKVESEETCERLKNNLSAQVLSYEAVKADNSSLVETLNAYEEYTKGMLKNFRSILTEHQEAMTNVNQLTTEIKSLQTQIEVGRKNIEVTDQDLKGLNICLKKFQEDKEETLVEVQKRFMSANSGLVSLSEALKKVTSERAEFERANRLVIAEKEELEKQIKTFKGNIITSNSVQEKLLDRNAELECVVTSSSQQILKLQNHIQSFETETNLSREAIKSLKRENTNLKTQLELLRNEINTSEQKHKTDLETLKRQLEIEKSSQKNINVNPCLISSSDQSQPKLDSSKDNFITSDKTWINNSIERSSKKNILSDSNLRTWESNPQSSAAVVVKEESPENTSDLCGRSEQPTRKNVAHNLDNHSNHPSNVLNKTVDEIRNSPEEIIEESKEDIANKLLEKENVKSTKRSSLSTPRKMSLKSLTISYRTRPRNATGDDSSKSPTAMLKQSNKDQQTTNLSGKGSQSLESEKFVHSSSPVRASATKKQDADGIIQMEVQTVENVEESFSVSNVEPVRKTYSRKRTSNPLFSTNTRPLSTNAPKKTRRTTK